MSLLCGQRRKVDRKVEKIIVDGTGEMRHLKNTVFLQDEVCECSCVAFGGCPRGEFSYWREIWLRRTASNGIEIQSKEVRQMPNTLKSGQTSQSA